MLPGNEERQCFEERKGTVLRPRKAAFPVFSCGLTLVQEPAQDFGRVVQPQPVGHGGIERGYMPARKGNVLDRESALL